jgi:hypothetical protein
MTPAMGATLEPEARVLGDISLAFRHHPVTPSTAVERDSRPHAHEVNR